MMEFLNFSLISTLITLAAGIVMWLFSRQDYTFKDLYNEGCDLYKRKQYKAALGKFKTTVARFPQQYQAFYNLGLCALKLKDFPQAKDAFLRALELSNRDVDIIYNLAYTEMSLGETEKATERFLLILKTYPDESDVLFNLGFMEGKAQNYEKAQEYITKAIEISPQKSGYKKYYIEILEALFEQKASPSLLEEILSICLELLAIYPNEEAVIYKTAVAYAKMGDWENSVTYCERMYALNPNSYKACSQYGLTLFCKGETSQAIEMYERAIHLAPDIPDTYLNLVFAYDKAGDFNSAVELVETFIKKFPNESSVEIAKDYLDRRAEEDEQEDFSSIDSVLLPSDTPKEVKITEVPEDNQPQEESSQG